MLQCIIRSLFVSISSPICTVKRSSLSSFSEYHHCYQTLATTSLNSWQSFASWCNSEHLKLRSIYVCWIVKMFSFFLFRIPKDVHSMTFLLVWWFFILLGLGCFVVRWYWNFSHIWKDSNRTRIFEDCDYIVTVFEVHNATPCSRTGMVPLSIKVRSRYLRSTDYIPSYYKRFLRCHVWFWFPDLMSLT